MYMLGRRRTCSRPSRTWICSAVYATSAPRDSGLAMRGALRAPGRDRSGRGFLTATTGALALPARGNLRDQLGSASGPQFYRILNTKLAVRRALTGTLQALSEGAFQRRTGSSLWPAR